MAGVHWAKQRSRRREVSKPRSSTRLVRLENRACGMLVQGGHSGRLEREASMGLLSHRMHPDPMRVTPVP